MPRILVVDDESLVCDVVTEELEERFGGPVDCAHNGQQAAEMLRAGGCHLAIVDEVLPDMRGIDLADVAAEHGIGVLLTTGHPDSIARLQQFRFPHLAKPFRLEDLSARVAVILTQTDENVNRVKAAITMMRTSIAGVPPVMASSRRLATAGSAANY